MRIVLLVLDGFPDYAVTPELTPELWALGESGGRAPSGGRCELPSSTYPSHGTLLTGRLPQDHLLWSGLASSPHPGVVPGWAGQTHVCVPTLFDLCRAANIRCAAILGDYKLYPLLVASDAHYVWPPDGVVPEGTPRDPFGYPVNDAVRPHLLAAAHDATLSFLFGHLNESDTMGHVLGPDSPEGRAFYRATDHLVGEVANALRGDWPNTVVIVLSDHGMEPSLNGLINLHTDERLREHELEVVDEGGCALVRLRPGVEPEQLGSVLATIPNVVSWAVNGSEFLVVEAETGHMFGASPRPELRGIHGGPGTASTVTIVAGGHPVVPILATAIQSRPPHLADWAPTIAALLNLALTETDGRNLAAR